MTEMVQTSPEPNLSSTGLLSSRQTECLNGAAAGRTSKQIARTLGIAPSTVDNHIAAAIRLLGCTTRAEAAQKLTAMSAKAAIPTPPPHRWLPPLGGQRNTDPTSLRFRQMIAIVLLGIAVSTAGIATILGIVQLLTK